LVLPFTEIQKKKKYKMNEDECGSAAKKALKKPRASRLVKELEKAIDMKIEVVVGTEEASKVFAEKPKQTRLPVISRKCVDEGVEGLARAMFSIPPSITLCSNRLYKYSDVEESLMHEMIHAYDYLARKMDLTDCEQLACSEIRSNREGECSGTWVFERFRRRCTRLNAINATKSMFPERASQCVLDMFERCYKDESPMRDVADTEVVRANTYDGIHEGTYSGTYKKKK
jgi:hypothetical protein